MQNVNVGERRRWRVGRFDVEVVRGPPSTSQPPQLCKASVIHSARAFDDFDCSIFVVSRSYGCTTISLLTAEVCLCSGGADDSVDDIHACRSPVPRASPLCSVLRSPSVFTLAFCNSLLF